jgi:hypothetical protein
MSLSKSKEMEKSHEFKAAESTEKADTLEAVVRANVMIAAVMLRMARAVNMMYNRGVEKRISSVNEKDVSVFLLR